MNKIELISILGPTASGKTPFAVALADRLDTEIISADSRQVYRQMDMGTGKDLKEYYLNGKQIKHHLIDICDAGEKYNVFEFQHDFAKAFSEIKAKNRVPILCGGTGMYIESVLKGYKLLAVPENKDLRDKLSTYTLKELTDLLSQYKKLHNKTDVDTIKRAIRAIEIEEYYLTQKPNVNEFLPINSLIIGLNIDRDIRRQKISQRLKSRLKEGMVDEVKSILNSGVSSDDLIYYGLEYKYLTLYAIGEITYEEMFSQLEMAIHQFAKRQMTWFRGMERRGFKIHWIDATLPMAEKVDLARELIAINS